MRTTERAGRRDVNLGTGLRRYDDHGTVARNRCLAMRRPCKTAPQGRSIKMLIVYSDSAAKAASRTCSTGPTPEILRYFGAPGRPDCAHLL
jgi:hypothetical protein